MTFPHRRVASPRKAGAVLESEHKPEQLETMGCTVQSAFYRQLFIEKFSGTYNQEHVTTDVLREGKEDVNVSNAHHLRAVIYPQTMLLLLLFFNVVLVTFAPFHVSSQITPL